MVKSKKRSIDTVDDANLPVYNAGNFRGLPSRRYIEVTSAQIMEDAWKKKLLWLLARLHSSKKQTIPSWTGFNILARNKHVVAKDSVGYLPTLNAPATDMSTVYQVLTKSLQIKETLRLQSIVVVFKRCTPKLRKHSAQFSAIGLTMEAFHTICTFLAVIGKRFQEAGLRDICVESGVIADGSAAGVLEGGNFNRAIRLHKIMFEALNQLAWNRFQRWIEEHYKDKTPRVDELMKGLKQLNDSTCKLEFKDFMRSPLFQEVLQLFLSYSHHLRHSNGKLSKFWMSYVDMMEVLLGLIRATREGNWSMHLCSLRGIVPRCFAYDNINYARYLSAYLSGMSHLP